VLFCDRQTADGEQSGVVNQFDPRPTRPFAFAALVLVDGPPRTDVQPTECVGGGARQRGDPLCHLGQRILTPRTQHHGSAGVAEGLRKALTQTRTGASDYRDGSAQAEPVDDRHGWSG
jgi:hypothetical protein